MLGEAEPVRALKQTMIEALADCLAAGAPWEETAPQRLGGAIIARLDAMLEAAPDRPLYLPEVCAAVGVSRRTLHNYCHQHIGTSPERYLRLRRLYMARRRLQEAAPEFGTVTRIATDVGFFELGRFAVVYRDVFGESPSATLRRRAEDRPPPAGRRIGHGVAALV
jgi:transcriptional regulator GlxA family with amidase domain